MKQLNNLYFSLSVLMILLICSCNEETPDIIWEEVNYHVTGEHLIHDFDQSTNGNEIDFRIIYLNTAWVADIEGGSSIIVLADTTVTSLPVPILFPSGEIINPNDTAWVSFVVLSFSSFQAQSKFIGFAWNGNYDGNNGWHYGWMKILPSSQDASYDVQEIAFKVATDEPIAAGEH